MTSYIFITEGMLLTQHNATCPVIDKSSAPSLYRSVEFGVPLTIPRRKVAATYVVVILIKRLCGVQGRMVLFSYRSRYGRRPPTTRTCVSMADRAYP